MNMKKLFDDFKSHVDSMTDEDIKKSIDNAVEHTAGENNMTIGDLIKNKDYDYVSYRLTLRDGNDIFAGCFSSKDGEIIPLDGDIYGKYEEVLSYEEWSMPEEGIQNGLTVVVEGEWISE